MNHKKEHTDSFGNSGNDPTTDPVVHISPKMEKYRKIMENYTVKQLHQIRQCLGVDFKTGNKDDLVSAILGFLTSLEENEQFQEWFESLPPYLSQAIEETSFKGYIDVGVVETAAGESVSVPRSSYYYNYQQTNPALRLAIFYLYRNYGRTLLCMDPLFRRLMPSLLPAPPDYIMGPCAEQESSGWSVAETLSESMPLLLKSVDQLLEDRSRHETILRRGLNKRDIKGLRKSSAFPPFPLGAKTGTDPIDLITRFLMIDPAQLKRSRTKDVRDFIKGVVKTFFTIPPSGKIVSHYLIIDSNFERSVLCPHVSKGPGPRRYRSLFPPHPAARRIFRQILDIMAEAGDWYDLNQMAESIQMQALPFTIWSNDTDANELIVKGEELKLPEGKIQIDSWEKGFIPDVYLNFPLITRPLLKGYCYLMASLGLLEIEEEEPARLLKKKGTLTPISPYDGLIRVRITPFGAWCLGFSKEKPELRRIHYEAIADRELPLITYRGQSLECKVFLERIGDPIGEDRFRVSEASFIRDCSSPEDIAHMIDEFHRLITKDPAGHWDALFTRVKARALLFEHEEPCMMIQLPDDRELRRLFVDEKKISSLVVRAEGGRIVVRQRDYKKLRKALGAYGVLKE